MNKKIEVGITGGIGAGKSLICRILHSMGYPVFYSDYEAKLILQADTVVQEKVTNLFGESAYTDGKLNRSFLAEKVFNDEALLEKLNAIVHPAVFEAFKKWSAAQQVDLVFNEAAILFETGGYKRYDYTLLVTAKKESRIQRVMLRDNVNRAAVENRMSKQWTDEQKAGLASFIIHNDDDQLILPQLLDCLTNLT